jgi:hypothetical protein
MSDSAETLTRRWLQDMVVGLNLCPFAAPVLRDNSLRIASSDAQSDEALLTAVLAELDQLQSSDESAISTTLLVFTHALQTFDDYLDIADAANDLLAEVGLDGIIQIATFHPDYCFAGEAADDPANYSNRSPYPMLHFIREAQMSRVLANYPNPEAIPDNNIRRLRELGREQLLALIAPSRAKPSP